jgi:MFS family permease
MTDDKRKAKDAARLAKYTKLLEKPNTKFYIFMLFAMIILVHLLDTYASDISGKVQSAYLNEFLIMGRGFTEQAALQYASILGIFGVLFALVAPFYKALMDKVGRRVIFIINICGMALGMLVCYAAPNFELMVVGLVLVSFFIIHDMQMVYVYEVAPAKWRSTIYFTCKFIGVFGTLAIPLMRRIYMSGAENNWRPLYLIPAAVGIVIFVLALAFMRESDVYLKNQVEYLRTPENLRKKDKAGHDARKTGIVPAIKVCARNKQLRWLMIAAACVFTSVVAVAQNYEIFMNMDGGMSVDDITFALTVQIIVMGIAQLVTGVLADFIGRKATTALFAAVTVAALFLFVFGTLGGSTPLTVGLLLGLLIGCYWNVTDLNVMMIAESSPTELRGSMVGVQGLVVLIGMLVSVSVNAIMLGFTSLGNAKLLLGVPGIILSAIIILCKVRDTKGTDMEQAGKEID